MPENEHVSFLAGSILKPSQHAQWSLAVASSTPPLRVPEQERVPGFKLTCG